MFHDTSRESFPVLTFPQPAALSKFVDESLYHQVLPSNRIVGSGYLFVCVYTVVVPAPTERNVPCHATPNTHKRDRGTVDMRRIPLSNQRSWNIGVPHEVYGYLVREPGIVFLLQEC